MSAKTSALASGAPALPLDEVAVNRSLSDKRLSIDDVDLLTGAVHGIINGDMEHSQENGTTSIALTTSLQYIVDGFAAAMAATAAGIAKQVTSTATLNGGKKALRLQRNNGATSTGKLTAVQVLTSADSAKFAGKTVRFRLEGLGGANFSAASGNLRVAISYGTGTDQGSASFYAGTWTGQAILEDENFALAADGTTWRQKAIDVAFPSTVNQIGILFEFTPVGTAGANDYADVTYVGFGRHRRNPVLEMLLAQHHFRLCGNGASGGCHSTTQAAIGVSFDPPMRAAPTIALTSTTPRIALFGIGIFNGVGSTAGVYNVAVAAGGGVVLIDGFTGLTASAMTTMDGDYIKANARL